MRQEEPPLDRYEYKFVGGIDNEYIFKSSIEVAYRVKFKPCPYLFDPSYAFSSLVFEFAILLLHVPEDVSPTSDPLIAPTIVAIFLDFYERVNNESVTIYICDSSDLKQHVRKRLFDWWYMDYSNGYFLKLDNYIKDLDETKYPVSLLLRTRNIYRNEIIEAFTKLIATYNHGK